MRDTDKPDEAFQPLGKPIRPETPPPAPRRYNTDGTVWQNPDGTLETRINPLDSLP